MKMGSTKSLTLFYWWMSQQATRNLQYAKMIVYNKSSGKIFRSLNPSFILKIRHLKKLAILNSPRLFSWKAGTAVAGVLTSRELAQS